MVIDVQACTNNYYMRIVPNYT